MCWEVERWGVRKTMKRRKEEGKNNDERKKVRKTSGIQWKMQNKTKRRKLGGGEGEIKPTNLQCM